jgi:hypothetical protein
MAVLKIKLNRTGIAELLKDPAVLADLRRRAEAIARAAGGGGMEVDSGLEKSRARASVRAADTEARKAEAKDRALTRAIDAGR